MIQGSSWFVRDPAGPSAQALAIERICARPARPWTRIRTADLPLGGVQVWAEAGSCPPHRIWSLHHRMAREISLAGWHTEIGPHRLLVLGWSAQCLDHRARVLRGALANRLNDHERTARHAVGTVTTLLARGDRRADADPTGLAAEAVDRVAHDLRWPARLADLDGLERTSEVEPLQLRLAQIAGLEAEVRRRCAEHLDLAWQVTHTLAGLLLDGEYQPPPARPPDHPVPRRAGTAERRMAASVPNHPAPALGRVR